MACFGPVESVGPVEAVQQSVRVDVRLLVANRDNGGLENGVGEMGVHGEAREAIPNAVVSRRILIGVVPSVGTSSGSIELTPHSSATL